LFLVIHHDNDTLHVSFGTDADPNRYPWTVALRGNDRDRCGGTLIDDQHVLTAAHCIGTRTTTVSLGSHLYDGGEEIKTSFYCVHNAYSSSNYYRNDIAIIRLVTPVTVRLPKRVATINLCNRSNIIDTTKSANTVHLWMVGWGLKNTSIEPNELQEAQVILADRSMCKGSSRYTDMCVQSRPNTNRMGLINLKKSFFNHFPSFSRACTGDSGSGLFQQTILTDQWCVLGVASSSDAHICEQTQFTTYVQASSQDYVEWFKDILDRKKTFDDLQKLERCKTRTWGQEFCRWYAC
jgi:secreted trypsin-like serine protease